MLGCNVVQYGSVNVTAGYSVNVARLRCLFEEQGCVIGRVAQHSVSYVTDMGCAVVEVRSLPLRTGHYAPSPRTVVCAVMEFQCCQLQSAPEVPPMASSSYCSKRECLAHRVVSTTSVCCAACHCSVGLGALLVCKSESSGQGWLRLSCHNDVPRHSCATDALHVGVHLHCTVQYIRRLPAAR